MKQQFPDVSSKYGAPMGRDDFVHNPDAEVTLFKVRFVDGDYDDGGAYWGGYEPLYCARDDEGEVQTFIRADSRKAAEAALLADHPDLKIKPDFDLDGMVIGYLTCALWASTDEEGDPLDRQFGIDDFSEEALAQAREDCEGFVDLCAKEGIDLTTIGREADDIGHDFWLTRSGHGTGFWDRGLGALGDQLTKWADTFGSCDAYVGDDGKVYFQ